MLALPEKVDTSKWFFYAELPFLPVSINRTYMPLKTKSNGARIGYTPEARACHEEMAIRLRVAKCDLMNRFKIEYPYTGPVWSEIVFTFPDYRTRDGHNNFKGLFDCLTKAGVIVDDKLMQEGLWLVKFKEEVKKTSISLRGI